MECAVRPAVLGDCPAITRLNREELGYDYPQEKTFAKLQACLANPAHAVFVAERGGEVVGYKKLIPLEGLEGDGLRVTIQDARVCPTLAFWGVY